MDIGKYMKEMIIFTLSSTSPPLILILVLALRVYEQGLFQIFFLVTEGEKFIFTP